MTTVPTVPATPEPPGRAVFTGVGVALVTLFDDGGALDAKATAAHAGRLADLGVRAVLVAGSTGEAAALTAHERSALVTAVREELAGRVPVIVGTGAAWGRAAGELTARARDDGADAALALSPPRVADPRRYYAEVAAAAGDLPLLAYHFPAVSAPGVPVELLGDLPVVGLKDSSGDPGRLLDEVTGYDGLVYTGSAALCALAGPLGATGAILALANVEPERCAAAFAGDAGAQRALADAHRAASRSFPHGIKELVAGRFGTSTATRLG